MTEAWRSLYMLKSDGNGVVNRENMTRVLRSLNWWKRPRITNAVFLLENFPSFEPKPSRMNENWPSKSSDEISVVILLKNKARNWNLTSDWSRNVKKVSVRSRGRWCAKLVICTSHVPVKSVERKLWFLMRLKRWLSHRFNVNKRWVVISARGFERVFVFCGLRSW